MDNLYANLEIQRDALSSHGVIFKGFFLAPATGDYRFLMLCDDTCKLKIDKTASAATSEWATAAGTTAWNPDSLDEINTVASWR